MTDPTLFDADLLSGPMFELAAWVAIAGPTPPFQAHSATSHDAAEAIKVNAGTLRAKVLEGIVRWGPCTDEYLAETLHMNPSTLRPRRVELLRAGLIARHEEDGRTRSGRKAARWVAA